MRNAGAAIGAFVVLAWVAAAAADPAPPEPEPEPAPEPPDTHGGLVTEINWDDTTIEGELIRGDDPAPAPTEQRAPISWTDTTVLVRPCCRRPRLRDGGLEAGVGFLGGRFRVGDVTGTVTAPQVQVGFRYGRLGVLGDYALMSYFEDTSAPAAREALAHRLGVVARYSVGTVSMFDPGLHGDLWLELGTGYQWLRWYGGGRLARGDVTIGFGGQGVYRWGPTHAKMVGVAVTVKVMVAHRPDEKLLPPTCEGPCDAPTHVLPYDVGYLLDVSIPFGR